MFFDFMRQSLILALKSDNEFVVFQSLWIWWMWLFQRRGPGDDIANLVTLKEIFASLKLYSLCLIQWLCSNI